MTNSTSSATSAGRSRRDRPSTPTRVTSQNRRPSPPYGRSPCRSAADRRCSPINMPRTTPCPSTSGRSCIGRTITHVVTGLELGPDQETSATHPIFDVHPLSGRSYLYLSTPKRCARVSGMSAEQAANTVAFLFAHSHPPRQRLPAHVVTWRCRDLGQPLRHALRRPRRRPRRPRDAPRHGCRRRGCQRKAGTNWIKSRLSASGLTLED